jgi:hypothetical protein
LGCDGVQGWLGGGGRREVVPAYGGGAGEVKREGEVVARVRGGAGNVAGPFIAAVWRGCRRGIPWRQSYTSLQRQKPNISLKERWTGRLECIQIEENKIDDISHMQTLIELKNI